MASQSKILLISVLFTDSIIRLVSGEDALYGVYTLESDSVYESQSSSEESVTFLGSNSDSSSSTDITSISDDSSSNTDPNGSSNADTNSMDDSLHFSYDDSPDFDPIFSTMENPDFLWTAFSSTDDFNYDSIEMPSEEGEPGHDYDFKDNQGEEHVRGEHYDSKEEEEKEEEEEERGVDTDHDHEFKQHPEDHSRGEEENDGIPPELIQGDIRGDITTVAQHGHDTVTQNGNGRDSKDSKDSKELQLRESGKVQHGRNGKDNVNGKREYKSRFQNQHLEKDRDSKEGIEGSKGGLMVTGSCAWDSKGCRGDCEIKEEIQEFCAKLESMEECTERKCVWIPTNGQGVLRAKETRLSLDMLMAARRKRVVGWVKFVVEITCVMLVGVAMYETFRWWRYRGYTKLVEDNEPEGDLLITIV